MSVMLTENTVGVWFVTMPHYPPRGADWLATIAKVSSGNYKLTYRFRYYTDDKVFDSEDEKRWYAFEAKAEDRAALIARTQEIAAMTEDVFGGDKWELMRGDGTLQQFIDEFMKLPFIHKKEAGGN